MYEGHKGKTTNWNIKQFLCWLFLWNKTHYCTDKVLWKMLIKEFPNSISVYCYTINCLRGRYNHDECGKSKIISMCYGKDGVIRTALQEKYRVTGEKNTAKKRSLEACKKMSKSAKKRCRENPEWVQQMVQRIQIARIRPHPRREERKVIAMVNGWFPGLLKSTGNTNVRKNYIGRRCPDSIFIDGQKKVIDYDGGGHIYSRQKAGLTESQDEHRRKRDYAKCGYHICFIRKRELASPRKLQAKIKKFKHAK